MSQAFKDELLTVLTKLTPKARARFVKKKMTWRYPLAFEAKLQNIFVRLLLPAQQLLDEKIRAIYAANTRKDSMESDIEEYLQKLEAAYVAYVGAAMTTAAFQATVDRTVAFLLKYNEQQLERYFMQVLGKKIPYSTEWWKMVKVQLRSTIETAATTALKTNITNIREFVAKSISNKVPFDKIVEGIQKINAKLSTTKAQFLARDIAGTYNSIVTRHMGTEILGTDLYAWATFRDERVRGNPQGKYPKAVPSHWLMDQLICRWSDPSTVSRDNGKTWVPRDAKAVHKHPGEDYACRCSAVPFMAELFAKLVRENVGKTAKS